MRRITAAVAMAVMLAFPGVAGAEHGGYHAANPCTGGCDAEYIPFGMSYDPYAMWETYGYPIFSGNAY